MKFRTIAIALAGCAGAAFAGTPPQVMQSVTVSGRAIAACTPPNGTMGSVCDGFDQLVRANFTPRQIGMLFGYSTSYPESLSGGIDRLHQRYEALLQQYVAARQGPTVNANSMAAK